MCELWERGGGPLRLPAARFDSKTLAPQGEAVLQGWASVGVVLETEVWEGRGVPCQGGRTPGSPYQESGMEQTPAPRSSSRRRTGHSSFPLSLRMMRGNQNGP